MEEIVHKGCRILYTSLQPGNDLAKEVYPEDELHAYLESHMHELDCLEAEEECMPPGLFSNTVISRFLKLVSENCIGLVGGEEERRYTWEIIRRHLLDVAPTATIRRLSKKWYHLVRTHRKYAYMKDDLSGAIMEKPYYFYEVDRIVKQMDELRAADCKKEPFVPDDGIIKESFPFFGRNRGGQRPAIFSNEATLKLINLVHANYSKVLSPFTKTLLWEVIKERLQSLIPEPVSRVQVYNRWSGLLMRHKRFLSSTKSNRRKPELFDEIHKVLSEEVFEDPQDGFRYYVTQDELERLKKFGSGSKLDGQPYRSPQTPVFTKEATRMFFDLVKEYSSRLSDTKFKKISTWRDIANAICTIQPGITKEQVSNKWDWSRYRYNNYLKGKGKRPDFFDEVDEILGPNFESNNLEHEPINEDIARNLEFIPTARNVYVVNPSSSQNIPPTLFPKPPFSTFKSIPRKSSSFVEDVSSGLRIQTTCTPSIDIEEGLELEYCEVKIEPEDMQEYPSTADLESITRYEESEANVFSREETLELLLIVEKNFDQLCDREMYKGPVWEEITTEIQIGMPGVSMKQVRSRWHLILNRYKRFKEKRRKNKPEFYDEIDALFKGVPLGEVLGSSLFNGEVGACYLEESEVSEDSDLSLSPNDEDNEVSFAAPKCGPLLAADASAKDDTSSSFEGTPQMQKEFLKELKRKNDLIDDYVKSLKEYVKKKKM